MEHKTVDHVVSGSREIKTLVPSLLLFFVFMSVPQPKGWCCPYSGSCSIHIQSDFPGNTLLTHPEVCFHTTLNPVKLTVEMISHHNQWKASSPACQWSGWPQSIFSCMLFLGISSEDFLKMQNGYGEVICYSIICNFSTHKTMVE